MTVTAIRDVPQLLSIRSHQDLEPQRETPTGASATQAVLRLVVAHPCRLIGEVLAQALGASGQFASINRVHGFEEVTDVVERYRPHVVLLAGVAGQPQLEMACEITKKYRCGVVVVATEPSRAAVDTALHQGNISLLSHQVALTHLLHAVRGSAMGCPTIDTSFSPSIEGTEACRLTARERDVLLFTTEGLPVKEIAARLFLTGGTVRNISSAAIRKLGARNRYEAARHAYAKGWL